MSSEWRWSWRVAENLIECGRMANFAVASGHVEDAGRGVELHLPQDVVGVLFCVPRRYDVTVNRTVWWCRLMYNTPCLKFRNGTHIARKWRNRTKIQQAHRINPKVLEPDKNYKNDEIFKFRYKKIGEQHSKEATFLVSLYTVDRLLMWFAFKTWTNIEVLNLFRYPN